MNDLILELVLKFYPMLIDSPDLAMSLSKVRDTCR